MYQNRLKHRRSNLGQSSSPSLGPENSFSPHFNAFDSAVNSAVNTPSEELPGFNFNYVNLPANNDQYNCVPKMENIEAEGNLYFAPSLQATPSATPVASPALTGIKKFIPSNPNLAHLSRPPSPYQSPFLPPGYNSQTNNSFQPMPFSLDGSNMFLTPSQPPSPTATPMASPPLNAAFTSPPSPLQHPLRHPYYSLNFSSPNSHMQNTPVSMDAQGNIFAIPSRPVSPSATPMASPSVSAMHPYLPHDMDPLSRPPSPLQHQLDGAFFGMNNAGVSQQPLQTVSISDMLALDTVGETSNNHGEHNPDYSQFFAVPNYHPVNSMNFSDNSGRPNNCPEYMHNRNTSIPTHITSFNAPQTNNIAGKGLQIRVLGVPESGAKSRVETQIKFCLQLVTDRGEKVSLWSHLRLPEFMVAKEKFKRKNSKDQTNPLEHNVLNLETNVICATDITRKVYTCISCVQRERKRALRKKENKVKNQQASVSNTPNASRASSPVSELGNALPGLNLDDEQSLQLEQRKILLFNCNELVDFSSGDTILPARITCYCRHHNEKVGFCIYFTMKDYLGQVIATGMSPPIMITDDHKSNKGKTANRKQGRKSEYEIPVRNFDFAPPNGHSVGIPGSMPMSSVPIVPNFVPTHMPPSGM
ncbi:SPT3 Dosage dependent suppressor of Ty-induced promoter mutations-like protein [Basidiobolus ranarum]|uniref:SPT3 Dosage dependent suppressor of Ty-induced promoter mutations-like protein n=1 Tax=Basidiobolus ranarum TaxID=34480 RepID=A0ABR2X0W4_9FUNG